MIQHYFKKLLLVTGAGLAAWLSFALFVWAEVGSASLGNTISRSLLGFLLQYGPALVALAVFLAASCPTRWGSHLGNGDLVLLVLLSLLTAAGLFFAERETGTRTDQAVTVLPRYRAHAVARAFAPGSFVQGEGILFRPGSVATNGYPGSIILLSGTNGGLYVDCTVSFEETALEVRGGWHFAATLKSHQVTRVPHDNSRFFLQAPPLLRQAGQDTLSRAAGLFVWRLKSHPGSGTAGFVETLFFAGGVMLLMTGCGLFFRMEKMEVGRRFLALLFWIILAAGPVHLLQYARTQLPGQAATLFLRGGIFFAAGLVLTFFGWRRCRRRIPPALRGGT